MTFAKTYPNKRYGQIVILRKQDTQGAPEIRFFFKPQGFGVCDFSIGWEEEATESKVDQAFDELTPQVAVEIVDGYMRQLASAQKGLN